MTNTALLPDSLIRTRKITELQRKYTKSLLSKLVIKTTVEYRIESFFGAPSYLHGVEPAAVNVCVGTGI